MTKHLPECPTDWCICPYLRACEQRCDEKRQVMVRAWSELLRAWSELSRDNFDDGFAAGLNAAREAVRTVNWFNDEGKMLNAIVATADALAAIDALREKP